MNLCHRERGLSGQSEISCSCSYFLARGIAGVVTARRQRTGGTTVTVDLGRHHYDALLRISDEREQSPEEVAHDMLASQLKFH